MTDEWLLTALEQTVKKAPDALWARIKNEAARHIADELLARLELQEAPSKRESMDRVNELLALYMPKEYLKGA